LKRQIPLSLFIASCLAVLFSAVANANDIYKWIDSSGKVHYSTTPRVAPPTAFQSAPETARAAVLPEIQRENIDQRISAIRSTTPPSCGAHGGIDCTKGADVDGSVICVDGFLQAGATYSANCSEVKLSLKPPTVITEEGAALGELAELSQLAEKRPYAIQFLLRNTSGIAAEGVRVEFIVPGQERFEAIGPERVEPFGAAEYILHLKTVQFSYPLETLKRHKVRAGCKNCGALIAINTNSQ